MVDIKVKIKHINFKLRRVNGLMKQSFSLKLTRNDCCDGSMGFFLLGSNFESSSIREMFINFALKGILLWIFLGFQLFRVCFKNCLENTEQYRTRSSEPGAYFIASTVTQLKLLGTLTDFR